MNIEEIKTQLGCIRGLANLGLDKIYFKENGKIDDAELKEELDACCNLLKMYTGELEEMLKDETN